MIKKGENMLITNKVLKENMQNYSNKDTKLSRKVKAGKIFKIINGLYETNANTPGYLLAGSIYGPSYISFEYALSYYGLIPERVSTIIPDLAYPEEIILKTEGDYSYQIATPEKALCDKLYTLEPINNYDNLRNMLFNDLRIDEDEFNKLNVISEEEPFNLEVLKTLLKNKFKEINYMEVKEDVIPFIKDLQSLDLWNSDFFIKITDQLM